MIAEGRERGQVGVLPSAKSPREKDPEELGRLLLPPQIPEAYAMHWDCFQEVVGPQGVCFTSEILAYLEIYQIDELWMRDSILRMVRLLSNEYARIQAERDAATTVLQQQAARMKPEKLPNQRVTYQPPPGA